MNKTHIRIRNGEREIEIDGSRKDVDDLLNKHWHSCEKTEVGGKVPPSKTSRRTETARRSNTITKGGMISDTDAKFDPVEIANTIKQRSDFKNVQATILHGKDPWPKIALTLRISESGLTSGQIHKVLDNLNLKVAQPNISKVLSKMNGSLVLDGKRAKGVPTKYRLTSAAEIELDAMMKKNAA